jgi:hypothetical protein
MTCTHEAGKFDIRNRKRSLKQKWACGKQTMMIFTFAREACDFIQEQSSLINIV